MKIRPWTIVAALAFLGFSGVAYAASNALETPVAHFQTSLSSSITQTATSMTLVSALTDDGTNLASSTYSFVINEGGPTQEYVIADCTSTVCTNMQRGLSVITGTTTVAASEYRHGRGESVKITDAPILLKIANILTGRSAFPQGIPITAGGTGTTTGGVTNGVEYFNGTYLTNGAALTWNPSTALLSVSGNASSSQLTTTGNTYLAASSGNVGIASTSPFAPLSVVGNLEQYGNHFHFGPAAPLATNSTVIGEGWANNASGLDFGIGNRSAANTAYNEMFFNNNLTDSSVTHYAVIGQNSSTYTDTTYGTFSNNANSFYLTNTDGPIQLNAATGTAAVSYINFATGGSAAANERMRITSAGNVGIGTTSPGSALSIQGNIFLAGNIISTSTATSTFTGGIAGADFCTASKCLSSAAAGGSGTVSSGSTGQFPFYNGAGTTLTATSTLFLTQSSKLGIGTTTSFAPLQIASSSPLYELALTDSAASADNKHWWLNSSGGSFTIGTTTDSYAVTATPAMTIGNNGNVAIGAVLSSGRRLLVQNSAASVVSEIKTTLATTGTARLILSNGTSLPSIGVESTGGNQLINPGAANSLTLLGTSNGIQFSGSGAQDMYLNTSGLFGIGTSSPVANFSVSNSAGTTTLEFGNGTAGTNKGTCIKLYRTDGTKIYASVAAGATTFTLSTSACATVTGF